MKKLRLVFLCALMLLLWTVLPGMTITAHAENKETTKNIKTLADSTIKDSGSFGDNLQWKLYEDGRLEITGSGAAPAISSSNNTPWYNNRQSIKKLIVANGVTSLPNFTCYECANLNEVVLADSVTSIGSGSFKKCTSLTNVNFLNKVTTLGSGMFENCTGLISASVPDTVTSIPAYFFENCSSLQTVSIGSGVSDIQLSAFDGCDHMTSFSVSSGNASYSNVNGLLCDKNKTSLFLVPKGLTELTIPDGITTIKTSAIRLCSNLEKVTISSSVTSFGSYNFSLCPKLRQIIVDPSNQTFVMHNQMLLNRDKTTLYTVTNQAVHLSASDFPSTLTRIESYCFYYNTSLLSIEIPSSVTTVAPYAFSYCSSLQTLKLSEGLTSIMSYAFERCQNLRSVSIPDSVTSMGSYAFYNCTKLSKITFGKGLTELPFYGFSYCYSLDRVIIPATITSLGNTPFSGCSTLDEIIFLGDLPSSNHKLISSDMASKIYYPSDNSSWNGIDATKFGDAAILCPYTNGNYEAAIDQSHLAIPGGFANAGCYPLNDRQFTYTNSETFFRQFVVKEAGGIYFLNGGKLLFLNQSNGILSRIVNLGNLDACYEAEGILYLAYDNYVYRYDLKNKKELGVLTFDIKDSISALGVDSQKRYYVSYAVDDKYIVALYDQAGNKLSQTYVPDKVYSFNAFDSASGHFYMESRVNYYAWGRDHYGHGLTMVGVTGNNISFIKTSNSYVEYGQVTIPFDSIEYLCANDSHFHQMNAEMLDGQYIVTTSDMLNRVSLINAGNSEIKWSLERKLDVTQSDSSQYDNSSVGVRAVLNKKHGTILIANNKNEIHEYDLNTKEDFYSYKTSHPVFSLYSMDEYLIVLEKERNNFYLEKISIKDPATLQISGNTSMKVGDIQTLKVNMPYRSITSSNPSVASINDAGTIAAWQTGSTNISVQTIDGRSTSISIEVIANSTSPVNESSHKTSGNLTNNISRNNYTINSNTVHSYLLQNADGSYTRVEYTNTGLVIENYGSNWTLQSTKTLTPELPLFGGFFSGKDANYLVYGQNNNDESDTTEVIRIVKYSKTWNRISALSIKGANTYIPFEAGSARMTETAGKLYLHTCHTMYLTSDGLHHQANMTFVVDESNMTVSDSYYDILNISVGYVSHSFNQLIQTDGTSIYRVDHGDGAPRAIALTKCNVDGNITDVKYTLAHEINGKNGDNSTGVSVGGLELSSKNVLITSNSVDMTDSGTYSASGKRNILLTVTDKKLTKTSKIWLTNYNSSSSIMPLTPQIVKLSSEHFLIMWEEYNSASKTYTCRFVTVDGEGKKNAEHTSSKIRLSDCQPILTNTGHVVWYVSDGSQLTFYQINPYNLPQGNTTDFTPCNVTFSNGSTTFSTPYTGNEIKPDVIVKDGNITLTKNVDYEIRYENNINAGTATIIITGKGLYNGVIRKTFTITKSDTINKTSQTINISPATITMAIDGSGSFNVTAIGSIDVSVANPNIISVTKTSGGTNTASYVCKALSTGSTSVTVTASGDAYHNSASKSFTAQVISSQATNLSSSTVTLAKTSYVYDGTEKKPAVTVTYAGKTLVKDTDYTLTYSNCKNAGNAKVTVEGIGIYSGKIEKTYTITPRSIENVQVTFLKLGPITENEVFDVWGIVDGNKLLAEYQDYTTGSCSSSTSNGYIRYLKVTFSGINNYTGSTTQTIYPVSSQAVINSVKTGPGGTTLTWKTESGAAGYNIYRVKNGVKTKVATITNSSTTSWTDTTVKDAGAGYSYCIEAYIINGSGLISTRPSTMMNTTPLSKKTNAISASSKTVEYSSANRYLATGAACYGGAKLTYATNNSNITVNASGTITVKAKYVGSATITIYSAETSDYKAAAKQITVTVIPSKTTLSSVSNVKGKKMLIKWKKNLSGSGYQIQYAKNSSFTSERKTVNVTKNTVVKKTIAKLVKGKKYYVRIRTFKKVGGKTYYSNWSGKKAVKIKK